ncbi:hypothetical protein SLAV_37070 [Streptomyces lavendulae subsp. lavendulae]|uniref:Uncharacterized protein n=1 Tax=Streptomyces lavendulae subsp. lavendulae TaxID=58340 RepID=A0A2K8PR42_STRLA|nr:hypothetical protein [Streptomyces lavendulae]ATZ29179.1 hypothetical protein SLAV_37070 [Streptomyces lavendulae subsp. lavendulae]QUQ58995.1 hypothetical protein SLLC_35230 [Streptomyces lavendulae subsp. lavendulae]
MAVQVGAALSYRQSASGRTGLTVSRAAQIKTEVPAHIDAISRAMRRTRAIGNIRLQATIAESVTPHV